MFFRKLKNIVLHMIYPHAYSSYALVNYLRAKGGVIGENVVFYKSYKARIDINNARFLKMGDNCLVTEGVVILAHDYSYSVVANAYGELLRRQKKTIIGSNVFIGMNSIILMGAEVGDNVIIGAGSVVSGKLASNAVYVGNPVRRICSLEEYRNKLKNSFVDSALVYAEKCRSIEDMSVYRSLFESEKDYKSYLKKAHFNGIYQEVLENVHTDGYPRLNWDEIEHM